MIGRVCVIVSILVLVDPALAQNPGGWNEAELWAWGQIKAGSLADFSVRCGRLDSFEAKDDAWGAPCREIRGTFVHSVLTDDRWRKNVPIAGVRVLGARMIGGIDLGGARIESPLWIDDSRIEGSVLLEDASFDRALTFDGSLIVGDIQAGGLRVAGDLLLRDHATVRGSILLGGARVGGRLDLSGSRVMGKLDGNSLRVDGNLFLRDGAVLEGETDLVAARVDGDLDMSNAAFGSLIQGSRSSIGRSMFLNSTTVAGDVNLSNTSVGEDLFANGSVFHGSFYADDLRVGMDLNFNASQFSMGPELPFARLGYLDIIDASLPGLDLSFASIDSVFVLATAEHPGPRWWPDAELNLRNASIGAFQDLAASWPPQLGLQGLTYTHLGAFQNFGREWLGKDPNFSRQPYQQLATVFRAAGDPDRADAVLYAARDRELARNWREEGGCRYGLDLLLLKGSCWNALGLTLLKVTIGYGLGSGYFLAVAWVALFTAIGVGVLWFSSAARAKGPLWCVGASLDHLLPIVELNKEFTDFFDDPKRERLSSRQLAYFAVQALIGYVLASFVVAGLAGLTQAR
jgi:hypothetical protein